MSLSGSRPARRTADTSDSSAFTTKEVALQIQSELRGFVLAHESRHAAELEATQHSRSDATATASGRSLLATIASVKEDLHDHEVEAQTWREKDQAAVSIQIADLRASVTSHERTIQRLVGAMALIVFLGGGAFILAALAFIARISGVTI